MKALKAYRFRLYPTAVQESLFRRTGGCCRFLYNLALEQRRTFSRSGRAIRYQSQAGELKALKAELDWLKEAPHHCLQQALRDLDRAFANFFEGRAAFPRPRRKHEAESFRFPDPKQFQVGPRSLTLPKAGEVAMRAHRPFQGRPKSVTVVREGDHWYACILVKVRMRVETRTGISETGIDIGVANPVVEADGTVHVMPRVTPSEMRRKARLQKSLARKKKGSRNRAKARRALARFEAKLARRRRDAQHRITARLVRSHTHIAYEDLNVRGMTASARGTVEEPGRNVRQKAGLNRSMLDVAPGETRRQIEYKGRWLGCVTMPVPAWRSSQECSSCGRHPADSPGTAHLGHGRVSRDDFVCPLCGFTCPADVNAARNIRARGRKLWLVKTGPADEPSVAACGALGVGPGDEAGKKELRPSGLPQAA